MIKRISRSLSDVAKEILQKLKDDHGVTDKQLDYLKSRVFNSGYRFPLGGIRVPVSILWIDYEVQRDVIIKTILSLLEKWDNRICQPAACNTDPSLVEIIDAAKNIYRFKKLFVYDAQHRCVTLAILGFEEIYVTVVVDADPKFASYAFRTSNSTVKKIGKPDFHRNNIRLYNLGVEDDETIPAYNLQAQFDRIGIDLVEKPELIPASERQPHYMSHFDYAYKPMGADKTGKVAGQILDAITTTWPANQKIQNGVYIGLYHMNTVVNSLGKKMPKDWMTQVCKGVAQSFKNSEHVEEAASRHAKWIAKTGTWSVPEGMFKFMREVYKLNGGALPIPSEGADFELDKGVWVDSTLIPNHAKLYKAPIVIAPQEVEYDYS
jgi:hypothetical protein